MATSDNNIYIGCRNVSSSNDDDIDTRETFHSFRVAFGTCISVCIVLFNLLGIISLYRCERMPFSIRILTINLCISGMLFSIHGVSLIIVSQFLGCLPTAFVSYDKLLLFKPYIVSLLLTTLLVVDRTLSMVLCMKYHLIVTQKRVKCGCIIIWTVAVCLALIECTTPWIRDVGTDFEYICIFPVCFLVNMVCYSIILRVVCKMQTQLREMYSPVLLHKSMYQSYKSIAKISTLFAVFSSFVIPVYIYNIWIHFGLTYGHNIDMFTSISRLFMNLNNLLNPFIYVWRFVECRMEMIKLVCWFNTSLREKYIAKGKERIALFLIKEYQQQT